MQRMNCSGIQVAAAVHAGAVFANVERSERKNGACMTAAAAACLGKLKATAGKGDGATPLPSACRFVAACAA